MTSNLFTFRKLSSALFVLAVAAKSFSEPGVADGGASPHAQVRSVGLDEVRWTEGFWAKRHDSLCHEMLPGLVRLMDGTNYTQYFRNFEIC